MAIYGILVGQSGTVRKRQVSTMIPSARPTAPPVAITISLEIRYVLGDFERRNGRTDNICKNSDRYRPIGSKKIFLSGLF